MNAQENSALEVLKKRYITQKLTKEQFENLTEDLLKCDEKFIKLNTYGHV